MHEGLAQGPHTVHSSGKAQNLHFKPSALTNRLVGHTAAQW